MVFEELMPLDTERDRRITQDWSIGSGELRNLLEDACDNIDWLRAKLEEQESDDC